jgi:predicted metal-dependent peptidase
MPIGEYIKETRLNRGQHRMAPYIASIIENYAYYAMLGMQLEHRNDDNDPKVIAYTDGKCVYAGAGFTEILDNARQRNFVILHEWAHNGLAHPARARRLHQSLGSNFIPAAWNIACDAIVNAALTNNPDFHPTHIEQPPSTVSLEKVLRELDLWKHNDTEANAVGRWKAEDLYHEIVKHAQSFAKTLEDGASEINGNLVGSNRPWVPFDGDVHEGTPQVDDDGNPISVEDEIRAWHDAFLRSWGTTPETRKRLLGDLAPPKTPWERELRDFLMRYADGRKRTANWARGARRYLALEHPMRTHENVMLPFEPDRSRPGRTGKIAVGIDTSGSITHDDLTLFVAELANMLERTGAHVRLIVCDAEVHSVTDFRGHKDSKALRQFTYTGGGGTDFRPIIEEATRWNPDCLVIFTDLCGPAGKAPAFPVKWAIPEDLAQALTVPFGSAILLPRPHRKA